MPSAMAAQISTSDSESDQVPSAASSGWRRLAPAATALLGSLALVALASYGLRSAVARQAGNPSSAVGLDEAPQAQGEWWRVMQDTIVRQGPGFDTPQVTVLYFGVKVDIVEYKDIVVDGVTRHRGHILKPVEGWVSLKMADGRTIFKKCSGEDKNADERYKNLALARGKMRNATQQLQAAMSVMKTRVGDVTEHDKAYRHSKGRGALGKIVNGFGTNGGQGAANEVQRQVNASMKYATKVLNDDGDEKMKHLEQQAAGIFDVVKGVVGNKFNEATTDQQ